MAKIIGGTVSTTIKVDNELNANSTNPVQNKVVTGEIDGIKNELSGLPYALSIARQAYDAAATAQQTASAAGQKASTAEGMIENNVKPRLETVEADVAALKEGGTVAPTDYVTPQMFGAKGDGKTNDTKAIQDAMDANYTAYAPDGTKMTAYYPVYIPAGTYLVNGEYSGYADPHTGGIKLHSGQRVYMDADCEIKVFGNGPDGWITKGFSNAFSVYQCENVEIHGGKIVGGTVRKYYQGAYYDPDWVDPNNQNDRILPVQCYGIDVIASDNVLIDNVDISDMRGDAIVVNGIYVTVDGKTVCQSEYSNRITIQNCHLHDCARQGISMLAGNNVTISNNTIHDIWGNAPRGGIDIEPLDDCDDVHDIIVENCRIYDCGQSICFSKCHDVIINNCVLDGYSRDGETYGAVRAVHDAHDVKFTNCKLNRFDNSANCKVCFNNCDVSIVVNNADKEGTYYPITHLCDCRLSGERFGHAEHIRAVVASAGEFYFKNCDFNLRVGEIITKTYIDADGKTQTTKSGTMFIEGLAPCRFDGCHYTTIPFVMGETTTNADRFCIGGDVSFNNCEFDINTGTQVGFLTPDKLIMHCCRYKSNGHAVYFSGTKDSAKVVLIGNIFECTLEALYVYTGATITTPKLSVLNNIGTPRNFVINKASDTITVKDINNNKI